MKVKIATSPTQQQFEEVDLSLTTRRGSECLIGRSPDSDLVLDSDDVSRLHGKFFSQGGHYYFCDTGSRNGSTVNGKLAEKDQSYMLRNGDIIRIGDFVLMLEEDMPESQQAETVVRIINPSVFSNWRQNGNAEAQQPNQVLQEQNSQEESIVNTSSDIESQQAEQYEPTFVQPEDVTATDNLVESPQNDNDNDEIIDTDDSTDDIDNLETENEISSNAPEYTVVQVNDIDEENDEIIDTDDDTENIDNLETENEISSNAPEYTVVQVSDIDEENDEIIGAENQADDDIENIDNLETENEISSNAPEYTVVQVSDIDKENDEIVGAENQADDDIENIDNLETENEISSNAPEYTVVQVSDIDEENDEIIGDVNQTDDTENQEYKEETDAQQYEDKTEEELVTRVVSEETSNIANDSDNDESVVINQETEEQEEPEEELDIQLAKILEEKQIVLVSHDSKKSELKQLVSEHEQFLSYCLTRTWQNFSDELYNQTGLSVTQEIPPPNSGGYQAINSLVNSGEILAVIFLRDLMAPQPGQANEEALLRICNINNVLLATNLPTAQAVVHYLKNLKD